MGALAVPATALGAGNYFGDWFSGLAGTPSWAVNSGAAVDPNAAAVARNSALGAVTALVNAGLMGCRRRDDC